MSASAEPALPEPSSAIEGIRRLRAFLNERIVGQEALNLRLLVALLADGHLLVEGAPGLAKTTAIRTLSAALEGSFHRIQFTPDLLPADLTGTEIFHPQDGGFHFERGPLFHNLLLADEINRAPAKVQSALLEAMAERQVTVGRATYPLPGLFLVMATQNPIEQEGTYPLPEAQLDRFLMYIRVGYPSLAAEHRILAIAREQAHAQLEASSANRTEPGLSAPLRISQGGLFRARREVLGVCIWPRRWRTISCNWWPPPGTLPPMTPSWRAGCVSAPARGRVSRWTAAPEPTPGCTTGITYRRRIYSRWPTTCSGTGCCCPSRRKRTG
jgi:MoxR-like ATPase